MPVSLTARRCPTTSNSAQPTNWEFTETGTSEPLGICDLKIDPGASSSKSRTVKCGRGRSTLREQDNQPTSCQVSSVTEAGISFETSSLLSIIAAPKTQ